MQQVYAKGPARQLFGIECEGAAAEGDAVTEGAVHMCTF